MSKAKIYVVSGHGRKVGAIGIFHDFSQEVQAEDESDASVRVYDYYEHITRMRIRMKEGQ